MHICQTFFNPTRAAYAATKIKLSKIKHKQRTIATRECRESTSMSRAYDSLILYYYFIVAFFCPIFVLFFFWLAHNICVPLTNKVYRYVQKTNQAGERERGSSATHTQRETDGQRTRVNNGELNGFLARDWPWCVLRGRGLQGNSRQRAGALLMYTDNNSPMK